jgi:protein SCO1/2
MDQTTERLSRMLWIGVGLVIVILSLSFVLSRLEAKKHSLPELPVLGQVTDFTLTNQMGQAFSLADLKGKVWLADIIFTRCPGPCPRMTRQMKSVQDALPKNSAARLVTLTTDPEYDTPAVLKAYAERFGADTNHWSFLTGTKKEIAGLAIDGLKLTALEKPAEERSETNDLFIHSTIFVVVDKQARLRGIFETGGEGVEWTNVQPAIVATIKQLEHER